MNSNSHMVSNIPELMCSRLIYRLTVRSDSNRVLQIQILRSLELRSINSKGLIGSGLYSLLHGRQASLSNPLGFTTGESVCRRDEDNVSYQQRKVITTSWRWSIPNICINISIFKLKKKIFILFLYEFSIFTLFFIFYSNLFCYYYFRI